MSYEDHQFLEGLTSLHKIQLACSNPSTIQARVLVRFSSSSSALFESSPTPTPRYSIFNLFLLLVIRFFTSLSLFCIWFFSSNDSSSLLLLLLAVHLFSSYSLLFDPPFPYKSSLFESPPPPPRYSILLSLPNVIWTFLSSYFTLFDSSPVPILLLPFYSIINLLFFFLLRKKKSWI